MTRLTWSTANPASIKADAIVVASYRGEDGPIAADPAFVSAVTAAGLAGATGKAGSLTTIPGTGLVAADRVVVVGLGSTPESDSAADVGAHHESLRKAAGAASRAVAGHDEVVSTLGGINLAAAAEGHLLGAYVFETYKKASPAPVESILLTVGTGADSAAITRTIERAGVTADAVAFARDLINTAPNDLYPAEFAARAAAAGGEAGLTVEVLDEKALADGGYGGILGVGAGSTRPPRLVRLSYSPANPRASVALVGKGITFDSGGISIKPAAKMDQMTSDMSGAAAVVATVVAAARLALPVAVTAYAALAENLPSGSAYRPGDVLRHYGGAGKPGKTVHVLNTDAEGRLVLADAIVRACEDDPDFLLEMSTLTGAQIVALGNRTMGVMGTPELRDRVAETARQVGEGGWAMPLPEHLREGLDSPLADLQNIAGSPGGGMLVAGHYLSEFVAEGVPWAHLDIAGPAFNDGKAYGYTTSGGTGVPIRTLLTLLAELEA
ncbi:MAG: leucyl aminopeptidase [Nakamurella sp.]